MSSSDVPHGQRWAIRLQQWLHWTGSVMQGDYIGSIVVAFHDSEMQ